ncbi:hypothetical protein AB0H76_09695 [Nocardia sp. NPDC050712]|uniref:hypothetical protein n=1 Tax=Nocardia sp. NPDC050712 TaxID=3155518 RepID=UPI00340FBACA
MTFDLGQRVAGAHLEELRFVRLDVFEPDAGTVDLLRRIAAGLAGWTPGSRAALQEMSSDDRRAAPSSAAGSRRADRVLEHHNDSRPEFDSEAALARLLAVIRHDTTDPAIFVGGDTARAIELHGDCVPSTCTTQNSAQRAHAAKEGEAIQ